MKVIRNEMIAAFDVDDTIVMWGGSTHDIGVYGRDFIDPHDGNRHILIPHEKHIKLLKDFKARGYTIVVWSGGGYEWAETVVRTLGLEEHVDLVMTKFSKYIDDLQAVEILGSRIYLKDD